MSVAIIILNYNGLNDTLDCLESVYALDYPKFEAIVIDNGSKIKPRLPILKKFPQTTVLENTNNLGFAEGCNTGIKYALKNNHRYILLLNNDTVINKNLLKEFVKAAHAKKNGGIFGAKILSYYQKDTIDNFGSFFCSKTGQFLQNGSGCKADLKKFNQKKQADYVCGGSFFIKAEIFQKIGFLEKTFFLMWEEVDFCYRAKKAGYQIWIVPKALIWHKISASFTGGKIHTKYFWWRGRLLWAKRNLTAREYLLFWRKFFFKEIFKLYKLKTLKTIELYLLKYFTNRSIAEKKILKVLLYKAALQGVFDYFLARFGDGPSWIKNSQKTVFYQRFFNPHKP